MSELANLLQIGLQAVERAKVEILKHYGTQVAVDWKPDHTPVTIADRNAELVVREFVSRETPGFGLIGEEFGRTDPDAEYQWIVDPIDGTKSFVRGVPLFGTILALYRRSEPLVGIIGLPALNSVLSASSGSGAWVDGIRVHVSGVESMAEATVLSGTLNTMEAKGYGEGFGSLRRSAQLYRGWGDCYGYYLVASGRAEIMVDPIVSIWDIAAMPVILSEAGGRFSEIDGNSQLLDASGSPRAMSEGYTAVASNGKLHSLALEKLVK